MVVGQQGFMASVWSWGDQGLTALNVGIKKALMDASGTAVFLEYV